MSLSIFAEARKFKTKIASINLLLMAIAIVSVNHFTEHFCKADIVDGGETFGAHVWATSTNANKNSSAQNGQVGFETAGQLLTNGLLPDITAVTSQNQEPDGSWTVTLNFSTVSSQSFIPTGMLIDGDEVDLWTMYIGQDTHVPPRSTNPLLFNQAMQLDSVESRWFSNGVSLVAFDDLANYNLDGTNGLSGFSRISVSPGTQVGVYESGSDLGANDVDQLQVTLKLSAVPEPVAIPIALLVVAVSISRHRRR